MSNQDTIRVQRPIREVQEEYIAGNTKLLEDVVRTWKADGRENLPALDEDRS